MLTHLKWNSLRLWLLLFGLSHFAEGQTVDFQRQILPLLSDRCFPCHGPDEASNPSSLRLDKMELAVRRLDDSGVAAIVPGAPEQSVLLQRVSSDKEALRMPPPDSNRAPLTSAEIELLKQWISTGARYERHWSWNPLPTEIEVPADDSDSWSRNEIDRFVAKKHRQHGLVPNREANRSRWLRRVSLALTGIPPTVAELQSFLSDSSPQAYETVVDRLLASRLFGEHMAVGWLDAARYADSYGYQSDQLCTVWPYRDWVIQAFNNNLSYRDFLSWQLAGDLLARQKPALNNAREQRIATAFNRLHRQTNEGGSIDLEWRTEYAADRVNTFGSAMLGLTVECARCHDHKFDAITQREYYQLMSFFNNIDEYGLYNNSPWVPTPSLLLPTANQQVRGEEIDRQIQQAREKLQQLKEQASGTTDNADRSLIGFSTPQPDIYINFEERTSDHRYPNVCRPRDVSDGTGNTAPGMATTHSNNPAVAGHSGQGLQFSGDDRLEIDAFHFTLQQPFSVTFWLKRPPSLVNGIVFHQQGGTDAGFSGPELSLRNGKLFFANIRFWPGNAIAVETSREVPSEKWVHVAVTYDGSMSAEGMKIYLDGQLDTSIVRNNLYKNAHSSEKIFFGERFRSLGLTNGAIDEIQIFKLSLTYAEVICLSRATTLEAIFDTLPEALQNSHFLERKNAAYAQELAALIAAQTQRIQNNEGMIELMVMEELADETPTFVLERGTYDAPRTEERRVERKPIVSLYPFPENAPRNRLGLAQWLTDSNHPLTSRVAVNRIWMNFFGQGLVSTAGDFGVQGQRPEQAELLDWLARDFVDHQWDVKRLCRQITLSATFRQDSRVSANDLERDPENRWLTRGPSQRLSAEQLRDSYLFVSGLLKPYAGGPPVSPYQPPGLWRENNSMSPEYSQSQGDDLFRRSVYSIWKRTAPLPNMVGLDAANREVCTVNRSQTSTPSQVLITLNDPQFVEAACHLAVRYFRNHRDPNDSRELLNEMFWAVCSRQPDLDELRILEEIRKKQEDLFKDSREQIAELFSTGSGLIVLDEFNQEQQLQLAALAMVAQAILNCDAALTAR